MKRQPSEKEMIASELEWARGSAYEPMQYMSRADRRTAKGRMLAAQCEVKALAAENEILRKKLERAE